jgi:hypothetical protein
MQVLIIPTMMVYMSGWERIVIWSSTQFNRRMRMALTTEWCLTRYMSLESSVASI